MVEFEFGEDREPTDEPKAPNRRKAVAVSQWRNSAAIAIGDETEEEWLTYSGEAIDVEEAA